MNIASSLTSVDTEYSADSIEFCPFEGFQDLFVCGTYQVQEPTEGSQIERDDGESDVKSVTKRTGRLLLYQIGADQNSL